MQGEKTDQQDLFYYGSLDDLVPQDDPFRRLDALLDLSWLRRETRSLYSATGRPSIDPVVIAKLLLIAYLQGITSERELMRQARVNLSYRRFLHYRLDEVLPDHSSLTRSRQRLGEETICRLFEYVLRLCLAAGLVGGELESIDSTFVQANASLSSLRPRLVAVAAEQYTRALFLADEEAEDPPPDPPDPPARKRDRLNDRYVSKTDAGSGLYRRRGRKSGLGYLVHFVVDRSKQVITGVRTTGAQARDAAQLIPLIDEVQARGIDVRAVAADIGYSSAEVYHELAKREIKAFIPQQPHGNERQGRFGQEQFTYDPEGDRYLCPNGAWLRRRKTKSTERRYRARPEDCAACPLREGCTTGRARTLNISLYEDDLVAARELQGTAAAKRAARERRICSERSFGEAKDWHGLRRAQRRGLTNNHVQALLTATAMNLKRYVQAQTRVFPAAAALRAVIAPCFTPSELAFSSC